MLEIKVLAPERVVVDPSCVIPPLVGAATHSGAVAPELTAKT